VIATPSDPRLWSQRLGRTLVLWSASLAFLVVRARPVAWLFSSSFQTERESSPNRRIGYRPADPAELRGDLPPPRTRSVTYETRRAADPATGGYIPSTAASLVPAIGNSLIVACAVSSSISCRRSGCLRYGENPVSRRPVSIYAILATRVDPRHRAVVRFSCSSANLGLLDSLWSLIITYLGGHGAVLGVHLVSYFESLLTNSTRRRGSTAARACRR